MAKTEERKNSQLTDNQVYEHKLSAYYDAAYQGIYENCMEIDRYILTLSSGAIGLLITCFYKHLHSLWTFAAWFSSLTCFIITIALILIIFHYNIKGLIKSLEDKDDSDSTPRIQAMENFLDTGSKITFVLGIILALVLAILNSGLTISIQNIACK